MKVTSKILLLIAALVMGALAASAQLTYTWSGASGADLFWATPANWDLNNGNSPGASDTALFGDVGVATSPGASFSNNVIAANRTIAFLKETNDVSYHNTLIMPGVSLTVSNIATNALVIIGGGVNVATTNTISGVGAALVLNDTNGSVIIRHAGGGANGQNAALDASALDTFNASIARLLVGGDGAGSGTNSRVVGTFFMAKTNLVNASASSTSTPSVNVGANNSNGAGGNNDPTLLTSFLYLGMTNAFFADSFGVGREKCAGVMAFNPAFTNGALPVAYLRGKNAPRVGIFSTGDESPLGSSNQRSSGIVDFTGGWVDALIDTAYIGKSNNGSNSGTDGRPSGTGTLTFGPGTLDVNTLELGFQTSPTGTGVGAVGTVNVNGPQALLTVNTVLELSHNGAASPAPVGTLNINGGTVFANRITSGGGTSTINIDSGTLQVASVVGNPAAPLTALNITNATLQFSPGFFITNIAVMTLNVGGTANHINLTNISTVVTYPTNFHLLQYATPSGDLSTFVLGPFPSASPAFAGYITNNTTGSFIDVVLTAGPTNSPPPTQKAVTWNGVPNGNWDTNTPNWRAGGVSTNYNNLTDTGSGDLVTFDDTLAGTTNVNLTMALSPGALTVNNTLSNYVFSGAGKISGFTGITKQGPGTLTLAENGADDFVGGLTVNGGTAILDQSAGAPSGNVTIDGGATVQLGMNDAKGVLPTGTITDNGTLVLTRGDSGLTLSTAITGAGGLTVNGSGLVTLTVAEPFTGSTVVANGTLAVAGPNSNPSTLSASSDISINTNGVIQVNADNALIGSTGTTPVTINAGGSLTGTAGRSSHIHGLLIMNGGTLAMQGAQPQGNQAANGSWDLEGGVVAGDPPSPITSTISAQFVVPHQASGTLFDITNGGTASGIDLNVTGTLVSGTSGTFRDTGIILDGGGTMALSGTNTYLGDTIINGATLRLNNPLAVQNSTITLNAEHAVQFGTGIGTFTFGSLAGPDSLVLTDLGSAPVTLQAGQNNANTVYSGILSGGGALIKMGTGTLSMNGTNLYTGSTTINDGILQLLDPASLSATPAIALIAPTATLDVSGRADDTLTLANNQTLNGNGTVNGTVTNFGIVSPGLGAATGVLTINGNVVLKGTTAMKIDKAAGTNDLLLGQAAMVYGGTLVITNLNTALAVNDSFQLFAASGGFSGAFSAVVPSSPGSGLSWDTNSLAVNGTLKVAVGPVTGPSTNANITSVTLSGTNLLVHGTNNNVPNTNFSYVVLTSTNIATALSNWTPVLTNFFKSDGTFDCTNPIVPGTARQFIDVKVVP